MTTPAELAATATDLHLPLGAVVVWATPIVVAVVSSLFALWNRGQEREMKHLAESIQNLVTLHEQAEKRFDERERLIRADMGTSAGIATDRMDRVDARLEALINSWGKRCDEHQRNSVPREDFGEIKQDVRRIFDQLAALNNNVVGHMNQPHYYKHHKLEGADPAF